jgi:REP element-mobilizing transposase RayT
MISLEWETLQKYRGANLPHWNCNNAIYHVCFRLVDSIPRSKQVKWEKEKQLLLNGGTAQNRPLNMNERKRLTFLFLKKIEACMDAGYGECLLRKSQVSEVVKDAIQYFNGRRYKLHAWCIMPNHVHVIVEPLVGHELSKIVHSWKSFTANQINRELNRTGQLWQHEPYDHIIRSEREYREQIEYVWNNPNKPGLTNCLRWRTDRTLIFQ